MEKAFLVASCLVLFACSSVDSSAESTGELTSEEKATILFQLKLRGFDDSTASFVEGFVIVEGDIRFVAADLLAEADEMVEKGYKYHQLFVTSGQNIQLVINSTLPSLWRTAFRDAAADWSNALWGGNDIWLSISEANTGPDIVVSAMNLSSFPFNQSPCVVAQGSWPTGWVGGFYSNPGSTITVNSGQNCGGCGFTSNWTAGAAKLVALHEIGHNLGMAHPMDAASAHVPDTASGTSYGTVMSPTVNCQDAGFGLVQDDRKTAYKFFGWSP